MQNRATHIYMLYLSPYIVTDWFCGTLFPFYFVIKRYEQTFRPGLCLSDSPMTVVHILTVGISLLDPYCLPRVQCCCYQFSCIVTDWVCGLCFHFNFIKRYERTLRPGLCLSDSHMTVAHNFTVGISLLDPHCLLWLQYRFYQFSCIVTDWICGTMFPFVITSSVLLLVQV